MEQYFFSMKPNAMETMISVSLNRTKIRYQLAKDDISGLLKTLNFLALR